MAKTARMRGHQKTIRLGRSSRAEGTKEAIVNFFVLLPVTSWRKTRNTLTPPAPSPSREVGEASENDKAVAALAALGGRDGVAQRWATTRCGGWFVTLVFAMSSHTSFELRVGVWFSR